MVETECIERVREPYRKLKTLGELDNYIESSVDKSNHWIIRDLTTTYEKLKALKEKIEPTSKQLRQSARLFETFTSAPGSNIQQCSSELSSS